jgi:hypothetical protein
VAWSRAAYHSPVGGPLKVRWETGRPKIDSEPTHWHPLSKQQLALQLAFREAPIGADDAMPGQPMGGCEDAPDQARRAGINVAVCAYGPHGNRTHARDDARRPR